MSKAKRYLFTFRVFRNNCRKCRCYNAAGGRGLRCLSKFNGYDYGPCTEANCPVLKRLKEVE